MGQAYRDLIVWQRAMQLTTLVYRLTQIFPREEQFGLANQMRRSAVSIPSNIAEGQGRMNPKEFRHFLAIARGSNQELMTQLEISLNLDFGKKELITEAENLSNEVGKMIRALIESLNITDN